MARLNPLRILFHQKNPGTTTWIHRKEDRRKQNLGRMINRRKLPDRRHPDQTSKNYEYIGLSDGGWAEVD